MKNEQGRWCDICEVTTHCTIECQLNLKNKQNNDGVYHTNDVNQNDNN